MSEFRKLLWLLEEELNYQQALLKTLSNERVAIVKLKKDQLDQINQEKSEIFTKAKEVEIKRKEVITKLVGGNNKQAQPPKFSDILQLCKLPELKAMLARVGKELRAVAQAVRELNLQNGRLIKQTIGIVSSTIAIFRAVPDTDLPTYADTGVLKDNVDPAFARRSSALLREA